ncbi:MAG: ABC transporter permease [Lachnospiraceae bacterium]|nr:ABC transporter permease [Lachnospiraceae bacterium]
MGRYILKRCLWMIIIVISAAIVAFTLMYLMPGDPARLLLGTQATEEYIAAKRHELGIDLPYIIQLKNYLVDTFLHFDLGTSWVFRTPVQKELAVRLPRTLFIGLSGMALNVIIGTLLGIFAAVHEGKWQDSLTMVIAMVFISCPDFFVAMILVLVFSLKLGLLPPYGIDSMQSYILPIISTALAGIAINARQARSSMLEVIRADFVTTARAKGQKEGVIVRRHMFPNAMMPIITGVSGGLAMLIGGSPVIESIFSIPGVGAYLLVGIQQRDQPIVRSCIVFFAIFTSIVMLVMDLAYAVLDPRIKAQYSRKKGGK